MSNPIYCALRLCVFDQLNIVCKPKRVYFGPLTDSDDKIKLFSEFNNCGVECRTMYFDYLHLKLEEINF